MRYCCFNEVLLSYGKKSFFLNTIYCKLLALKREYKMKYPIDSIVTINNCDWRVAEYRLGRGREWVYTLSNELVDGSFETMRINETAIGKIIFTKPQNEVLIETSEGIVI